MRIFNLHWPMIIVVTLILYALIIIWLPFNTINASIFLLALIAYWSRLPGVGIMSPLLILYYMDFVDIFSMLIAIYVGPVQAIMFTLFTNYSTRMSGVFPDWVMVIKDGIAQSLACLLVPIFHSLLGANIMHSIVAYTILRAIGFFILWIIWPPWGLIKQLSIQISENSILIIINLFYGKYFSGFLNNILGSRVNFNWMLFCVATAIICIFTVLMVRIDNIIPNTREINILMKRFFRLFKKHKEFQDSHLDSVLEAKRFMENKRYLNLRS